MNKSGSDFSQVTEDETDEAIMARERQMLDESPAQPATMAVTSDPSVPAPALDTYLNPSFMYWSELELPTIIYNYANHLRSM